MAVEMGRMMLKGAEVGRAKRMMKQRILSYHPRAKPSCDGI